MKKGQPLGVVFMILLLTSVWLVGSTSSAGVYSPWYDTDDDGDIDIFDMVRMAGSYGTTGEPYETKAALAYDSGWINISGMTGQSIVVTHGLSSLDIMVDLTGKSTGKGGAHQKQIGGEDYAAKQVWNNTYGGVYLDFAHSMIPTADGGYALAGYTYSYGAGNGDVWLVKADADGDPQWNRTYGGPSGESARSLVQTGDGGFLIAGATTSYGAGSADMWLVKTDALGNAQWNKTYGGLYADSATSVIQTSDGGYAVAGYTQSSGAGGSDFWLIKTNSLGVSQWIRTYGGATTDEASSLVQTPDGGYAVAGYTYSMASSFDFWLVKTASNGNAQWNETYGGSSSDVGQSMVQTADGGYVMAGYTASYGAGAYDFWVVKADADGNMLWSRACGGSGEDNAYSVALTRDGEFVVAGSTYSFGAGHYDFWLVRMDAGGNARWTKTYGGTDLDEARCVVQTEDGGFAIAGRTASYGVGADDLWLVKTDAEGNAQPQGLFKYGLAWTNSSFNSITLYRGTDDIYWNYVRVRIWIVKGS